MTSPAGWYPDPDGSGGQRYFDGQSWTDQRLPSAAGIELGVAAPPRSRSLDAKVIAGLAAAAVLLVAGVGVGLFLMLRTADTDVAVMAPDEAETSAPSAVVPNGMDEHVPTTGQEVRDGDFSFVVTGVDRVEAVTDPEFPQLQKVAAGEYIIVRMTVTNIGTAPRTFFASFHTLSDGATTYESDDEAWIYLGNTLADLNPGDSVETAVVFDVPEGTQPQSVELHAGPYSDGVTVDLE